MEKTLILSKQEEIQNKLALIKNELKKINVVGDTAFKTSGKFKFSPVSPSPIDIKTVTSTHLLIETVSFLNAKSEGYNKAAEEMGLKQYPEFKWLGYNVQDWKHDVKLRIDVLTSHDKRQSLLKARDVLEKYVTEETKMLQDLQSIDELIGL
jgi:hypothetical protein